MMATLPTHEDAKAAARKLTASLVDKGYRPSGLYVYEDAEGIPLFWRIRLDHPKSGKWVRPLSFNGNGWELKEPDFQNGKPLYGLSTIVKNPDAPVWVVEGEKCADTLAKRGFASTTSGSSTSADKANWKPLAGRNVILWPDNDEPGKRYMAEVSAKLLQLGCHVQTVDIARLNLPEGGDCVDWLAARPGAGGKDVETLPLVEAQNPVDDEPLSAILGQCGFDDLSDKSPVEDIHQAVKGFASAIEGRDPVWLKLAHGEIVKRLEDIGVKGAAKVVSSAFKPPVGEASKARGSKPVLFEDVEPWPEPADGAGLLDEITAILKRFVIMPEMANVANSLWILHAWAIDSFQVSPLLRIESPAKGCGKSTLLMVNGELLPRNLSTANITTASLFRLVDSHGVSLCIDETDTSFRENQDLIGLVNAGYLGYLKKTAIAPRCDGDSHEVKLFSSWCPKVLAGIGRLSDTTESRCIRIRLERKLPGEKTEPFSLCKTEIFAPIKEKLARWSADNLGALAEATPDIPKGLGDRAADNWRPLLAVADLAGGPWPEQARKAALELSGNDAQDDDSPGMALFEDIKEFFEHGHTDTVSSETLVNHLVGLESRPWAEWRQGKPISKNGLARLLKKFGIGPRQFKENGDKTRGYFLDDFWEVFSRYLQAPGNPTGTTGTVRESKDLSGFSNGTEKKLVPDGNNDNLFENRRVPVVPDGIPGMSEKKEIGGLFEAEEFQV